MVHVVLRVVSDLRSLGIHIDAKKRLNHPVGWPAATLVLGPVVLPVYFAKRNLQAGEVREGGTGWNVIKNFALFWTLTVAVGAVAGMVNVGQVAGPGHDPGAKGGRGTGRKLGDGDDLCAMVCSIGRRADPRPVSQEVEHRGTRTDRAAGAGIASEVNAAGLSADAARAASAGSLKLIKLIVETWGKLKCHMIQLSIRLLTR